MLSKKKKIFVLVGMVALLVVTGCLNIFLNSKSAKASGGDGATTGNFFSNYRLERSATRTQTILQLDAIIANEATSAEAKRDAENQKLEITKSMTLEVALEGLIKALGFEEAVVTSTSENVNIIVKAKEMTENQAAQILDIIVSETGRTALDVRIIPVE